MKQRANGVAISQPASSSSAFVALRSVFDDLVANGQQGSLPNTRKNPCAALGWSDNYNTTDGKFWRMQGTSNATACAALNLKLLGCAPVSARATRLLISR